MEQTATGILIVGWKLALALVAGSSILTTFGVWALARFTHVFDAYAGERAKLLAQFHNLDRLVQQTEKLTSTTETIKARISDELWDRQMRWSYKRDIYVKIIERITELIGAEVIFQAHEEANYSTSASLKDMKEKTDDFMRLCAVAPLVLSERATKTLWNLRKHTADEIHTPAHIQSLRNHLMIFQGEAMKDLGFTEGDPTETENPGQG